MASQEPEHHFLMRGLTVGPCVGTIPPFPSGFKSSEGSLHTEQRRSFDRREGTLPVAEGEVLLEGERGAGAVPDPERPAAPFRALEELPVNLFIRSMPFYVKTELLGTLLDVAALRTDEDPADSVDVKP